MVGKTHITEVGNSMGAMVVGDKVTITRPDTRRWKVWLHRALFLNPPVKVSSYRIAGINSGSRFTIQ